LLEALLASLVYRFHGYEYPVAARRKIYEVFDGNGQFSRSEIDAVLAAWEREPSDAPTLEQWHEWGKGRPARELLDVGDDDGPLPRSQWRKRLSPPLGLTDCEAMIALGQCTQGPPMVTCESCGQEVLNVPQRVGMGAEGWLLHLSCPSVGFGEEAPARRAHASRRSPDEGELETKERFGEPVHIHPNCPKAQGAGGFGVYRLRTVWLGPDPMRTGVKLSYECSDCGEQVAVEPPLHPDGVELADVEKGAWRHHKTTVDALLGGENHEVEYKETWRIDAATGAVSDPLRDEVVKAVAAFRNADGGAVLVGVNNLADIIGLGRDLAALGGDALVATDKLVLQVSDHLKNRLGDQARIGVAIHVEDTDGGPVLLLKVEPAEIPEEVQHGPKAGFWVRRDAQAIRLTGADKTAYVARRFGLPPTVDHA
jgi:hypothetical protein